MTYDLIIMIIYITYYLVIQHGKGLLFINRSVIYLNIIYDK